MPLVPHYHMKYLYTLIITAILCSGSFYVGMRYNAKTNVQTITETKLVQTNNLKTINLMLEDINTLTSNVNYLKEITNRMAIQIIKDKEEYVYRIQQEINSNPRRIIIEPRANNLSRIGLF